MDPIGNVKFLKRDFLKNETKTEVITYFNSLIDVIISDMAAG